MSERSAPTRRRHAAAAVLALLIAAAVAAIYAQTAGFGYVFDDESYVVGNPGLKKGLTLAGVRWAFTAFYHANWHPLAWMAHLADRAVFGDAAGPAHLVNAGLHAACAALLLLVLRNLTGALLPSALAAAFFALHPLRVESVAWVTERKDALSTIFWLLAVGAHLRYARRPVAARYAPVAIFTALGLLTKPMVVTLPAALLLLDLWPLGRLRPGRPGGTSAVRLLLEKLPLLALAAGSAAATIASQSSAGAVQNLERFPIGTRLANALASCLAYLGDSLWPAGLAAFYPHPGPGSGSGAAVAAAVVLSAVTAAALWRWRRAPALATGWLWFLVTLVPVIGLVQVGAQARADRYTYLPSIGLSLAVAFGAIQLSLLRPRRPAPAAAALVLLVAFAAASWRQTVHWRDDATLYRHALAVTERNWLVENNLGRVIADQGDPVTALAHYDRALSFRAHFEVPHFNRGMAYEQLGRREEALAEYDLAQRIRPEFPEARFKMADILSAMGRKREAITLYRSALPGLAKEPVLRMNLANALSDTGANEEALAQYAEALRLDPKSPLVYANRGVTYKQMGRSAESSADFRDALRMDPQNPLARRALGLR